MMRQCGRSLSFLAEGFLRQQGPNQEYTQVPERRWGEGGGRPLMAAEDEQRAHTAGFVGGLFGMYLVLYLRARFCLC